MKNFFSKDINIILFSFGFVIFMLALSNLLGQQLVTAIGVVVTVVLLVAAPFVFIKSYKNHKDTRK
jgi:uncharacterized membrane protein YjgN (DUF898 family)